MTFIKTCSKLCNMSFLKYPLYTIMIMATGGMRYMLFSPSFCEQANIISTLFSRLFTREFKLSYRIENHMILLLTMPKLRFTR